MSIETLREKYEQELRERWTPDGERLRFESEVVEYTPSLSVIVVDEQSEFTREQCDDLVRMWLQVYSSHD